LFLDTDTYLCGSPSELFDLAGKFDIAMALDRHYYDFFPEDTAVPGAFCEFNQGSWCSGTRRRCRRWFRPRWTGRRISTAETGIPIGD
ncbi:MAG TPA: hypothetical protein VJQ48_13975, partial [Candidatus Binatia bacterium]|nr:hypothetical protein [Candidatus Binatia bacterium]